MSYQTRTLTDNDLIKLFAIEEDHFNDFKAKDISSSRCSWFLSDEG